MMDPTLWSSLYIHLQRPSTKLLRQVAYFAEVCFARSKDIPLTFAISISNLFETSRMQPLILALIAHEARWSRIAINFIRPNSLYFPKIMADMGVGNIVHLKTAGADHLKEFHFNFPQWFIYSMTLPFRHLETLRIASSDFMVRDVAESTLKSWLPLSPNLTELEVEGQDHFIVSVSQILQRDFRQGKEGTSYTPPFLLPKLRILIASPHLLSNLTCPALEKYVLNYQAGDFMHGAHDFLAFVERSTPPLHTLHVRDWCSFSDLEALRGYLIPSITSLAIIRPGEELIDILSRRSEGGVFSVLPGLEHIELHNFEEAYFKDISKLLVSRWKDAAGAHRSLKSVKLVQCFDPIPRFLTMLRSAEPIDYDEMTLAVQRIPDKWREITRCAADGLQFFFD
ncbi:hypothetical protein SCHPADRAFT_1000759 [Schizopora paradoxa]|uniref:F-box domain-containing protein n=1 Tax=Schizopora paradoxa TaxID=27342 RepID=A0A0H2RV91_9AGAM|nr:hypothetical protein SCHPADRAFT_1000759 [Schizopora paradoxa]